MRRRRFLSMVAAVVLGADQLFCAPKLLVHKPRFLGSTECGGAKIDWQSVVDLERDIAAADASAPVYVVKRYEVLCVSVTPSPEDATQRWSLPTGERLEFEDPPPPGALAIQIHELREGTLEGRGQS